MTRINNELIYELLNNLQADISELKSVAGELKEGQMGLPGPTPYNSGRYASPNTHCCCVTTGY